MLFIIDHFIIGSLLLIRILKKKKKFEIPKFLFDECNWRESSWTGCHAFHGIFNTRHEISLALQTRHESIQKTGRATSWTMSSIIILPVWKLIFSRQMLIERVQFRIQFEFRQSVTA